MTDEELIARWLAENEPTRCPTRFCVPTMVNLPEQENPAAFPVMAGRRWSEGRTDGWMSGLRLSRTQRPGSR